MICPICHTGEIENPKKKDGIKKVILILRKEGYSVRQIAKFLNFKSPNSIQRLLK